MLGGERHGCGIGKGKAWWGGLGVDGGGVIRVIVSAGA